MKEGLEITTEDSPKNGAVRGLFYTLVIRLCFFIYRPAFYTKDGCPIRCSKCGCTVFTSKVTETAGHDTPCEEYTLCKNCGATCAFWAYGYFDPKYRKHGAV